MPRPKLAALLVVAVIAVATIGLLLLGGLESSTAAPGSHGPAADVSDDIPAASDRDKPNIVVISTDDQTLASFKRRTMPETFDLLVDEGTAFTDSIVVTPVCCPSRATYLTGQYGHNHGILTNNPGYVDLRRKGSTLPVWMQQAGYRTIHVGKYLNKYSDVDNPEQAPPGWDDWRTELNPHGYYDYTLGINGEVVEFGSDDGDYLGRVLAEEAVGAIQTYAPEDRPFFLTLDEFAPHNGRGRGDKRCRHAPIPDPADQALFEDASLPRPPSFNERDVSDKPSFIRKLDRLTRPALAKLEKRYTCTLASLRSIDRGVTAVYDALAEQGELENTVIVYWSDNGYFDGEHRLANKKQLHYEEGLRVPIVLRVGSEVEGSGKPRSRVGRPVANIDLAPTILDYAGGESCREGRCRAMDGLSMRGLVRGGRSQIRARRPLLIEFENKPRSRFTCAYQGVRVPGRVYIEHTSIPDPRTNRCHPADEAELYDLEADPYQLDNLNPPRAGTATERTEARLRRILGRLRDCRGVRGRDPRRGGDRSFCG